MLQADYRITTIVLNPDLILVKLSTIGEKGLPTGLKPHNSQLVTPKSSS
jgi:hypothetical protein